MGKLRLKSFSVDGLFGLFNHEISLNNKDRITIIHGPNGVGKTAVLRLMEAISRPHSLVWRQVSFKSVSLKFYPSGSLSVTKQGGDEGATELHFVYRRGKMKREATVASRVVPNIPLSAVDDVVPWLRRMGARRWHDERVGDLVGLEEIFDRYPEYLPSRGGRKNARPPSWLSDLLGSFSTQFIRTHRLRQWNPPSERHSRKHVRDEQVHSVERLSADLAHRIQASLRESGSLAASLDRTFPKRLLESTLPDEATVETIRSRYQEQEALRERLMDAGLLDAEDQVPLPDRELDDGERKVLWYYLRDVNEKLGVYTELLERVELFKRIIDEKKFLYKTMSINKSDGFQFNSALDSSVPLTALSSGEQHELVLIYELLFGSQDKNLILIDEPELSLHVLWQKKFLSDMEEIAKLAGLDFVIATHSPAIVSHRTDLMVELSGGQLAGCS